MSTAILNMPKYLQTLDYVDADKIGIIGGSYGGYMTMAALTFAPEEFEVGVNIFGVTNWLRTLKSIPPYWESFRGSLYKEIGDPYSADSTRLYNISPLHGLYDIKSPVAYAAGLHFYKTTMKTVIPRNKMLSVCDW